MIDFSKRGLRLGYLLRGALHDSAGAAQTLRLSGPSSRVGSGHVAADPDDGAAAAIARRRYWRAGASGVSLVDDAGKLSQHIGIPGQLSITVPLSYPLDARTETTDDTDDATLRAWVVSGRWANRRVDVWLVDLDTGASEHRFRGTWDRSPDMHPGSISIRAREWLGPLAVPWKMTQVPHNASEWSPDPLGPNLAGLYTCPNAFFIDPALGGKFIGSTFGHDPSVGATSPGRTWMQVVPYGVNAGFGLTSGVGHITDPVYWFHVSPQYGCRVGGFRMVSDAGAVEAAGGSQIAITGLVAHNYNPARGPLGTVFAIQVQSPSVFSFLLNSNQAWARVSGPSTTGATVNEWSLHGEPFTTALGTSSDTVREVADVIDLVIDDAEYLGLPTVLGPTAIAEFKAAKPATAHADFGVVCTGVPALLTDKPITYRDALSSLMAGLPADLLWRFDASVGGRRLFPRWRRPTLGGAPDYMIGPDALVYLAPMPSIRQSDDPGGEYSNDLAIKAPDFINQPAATPIPDPALLSRLASFSGRILDAAEQAAGANNGVASADRSWAHWSCVSVDGSNSALRFLAGELSQPQTWTEAELGGRWYKLQLGDTVAYQVHGITGSVGMVRRLEYDLEAQTVTVSAVHVVFYETDGGGGGD